MSSSGYAAPLRIEVTAVTGLRWLYLLFGASLVPAALSLPLPFPLILLLLGGTVYGLLRAWYLRSDLGAPPVTLVWDAQQRWWLVREGAGEQEYRLRGSSYLSPRLAVLCFISCDGRRRRAMVMTPDSVGAETFRRLQVRFRLYGESLLAD